MINKVINFGVYLIVFILPLYLIRFKIAWVPFNILEGLIIILFVLWLVTGRAYSSKYIFYPIFLIFLGVTIATLFSEDISISAGIFKSWFISPLLFFIVLINVVKNKKQIKNILLALFCSGLGVCLIALFYWLTNKLTYDGRLQAFYLSPNYLAMYLSPILILSLYLYFVFDKKIIKLLLFIAHCLLFIILYLTFSYGAWLGVLAALIFILFAFYKFKPVVLNKKIVIVFVLLILVGLISQIPSQKFQGLLDLSYPSLESRLVIWQSAWEITKDHSLIGIGPGMFQKYYLAYQVQLGPYLEWATPQPHSLFLAFWLQAGLLGLVGLIWLLIIFFKGLFYKKLDKEVLIINIFLGATMVYILAHGLVDTTYWKNDLALIFWLIIALGYKGSRFSY
ncbi:MAG: hypothetical protein CMI55_02820 [Parcubacteria group bacterium]|jgi:O-antigen ligase|nr:hypothetical protein [Parcubacteria group bacterium]|tara:strand:- start:1822 stop:3003 length:1182 start_codon:yes stop_codon:yes gene_type:complete